MGSAPSGTRTLLDIKFAPSTSPLMLVLFLIYPPPDASAEEENEAPPVHSLLEHTKEYFQENQNPEPTPVPDLGDEGKIAPAWQRIRSAQMNWSATGTFSSTARMSFPTNPTPTRLLTLTPPPYAVHLRNLRAPTSNQITRNWSENPECIQVSCAQLNHHRALYFNHHDNWNSVKQIRPLEMRRNNSDE